MNTNMHGRAVRRIEYIDGPLGNPQFWEQGLKWTAGQSMVLSATYHGDRDEFWLVLRDADGKELERRRAATVERIVWMEPLP